MASTSVKVALRVRPLTAKEMLQNECECLSPIADVPQIVLGKDRSFTYDHVFWTDSRQETLFEEAVRPLLDKFLNGYNATVLAYGQTGSGKTYSMGTGLDGNLGTEHQGIVPRSINTLFSELPLRYPTPSEYSVHVSFLEVYNEELIDLLNPGARNLPTSDPSRPSSARGLQSSSNDNVRIREDEFGNIVWIGIREEFCESAEHLMGHLNKGSLCRTTGSTDMNMVSSRSHAIFSVTLRLSKVDSVDGTCEKIMSKFHFVDLAGSERLKKTNAEGARAKEGISINSGLLALGNVISALGDESRLASSGGIGHVPYRDSKLTRLLQDSLGGNSATLMLACVSPADTNFQETLSTLKYANRARNIKNKVTITPQTGASAVEVQQLRTQISRLKLELATLKEQYGLGNGSMSASNSFENLDQHTMVNQSLRSTVADLQNERGRLELLMSQLQTRVLNLEHQIVFVQAERDTLLSEKNQWHVPSKIRSTDDVMDPASTTDNEKGVEPVNPLILSYLTKIAGLEHDLVSKEHAFEQSQKLQAITNSSLMYSSMSLNRSISAQPRQFRFVLPPTASSSSNVDEVQATLTKTRNQMQQDMKFLQDIKPGALLSSIHLHSSPFPKSMSKDDGSSCNSSMNLDNVSTKMDIDNNSSSSTPVTSVDPMDTFDRFMIPTWEKEPMGSEPTSPGDPKSNSTPELLHRALHKIQADLAVKEELMARLETTHKEYMCMRETYESKLDQLQQAVTIVQGERDEALQKMNTGGVREREKDIRARYETKVKKLLSEISVLRKDHIEATKAMSTSKKSDMMLKHLRVSVEGLRSEKLRLIKKMREEGEKARDHAAAADREIQKLRRKERLATEAAKKYERNYELQKVLLKRRAEEIVASNQKLKSVTALLKRSSIQKPIGKPMTAPAGPPMHQTSLISLANHTKPVDSSNKSGLMIDTEQREAAVSYQKHQLYKEIETLVTTQQLSGEMEQLAAKRTRLSDEKVELLVERERVMLAEAERQGCVPDPSVPQYMDDRLEAIDAELQYVEVRIKTVQNEVVLSDAVTDNISGYESVLGAVRLLDSETALQLLEELLEDMIQIKISSRNQALECKRQEMQIGSLRKNLLLMRKTAMTNAVDYEKRITNMAVDAYLKAPGPDPGNIVQTSHPPSYSSSFDAIMGISVFPNGSSSETARSSSKRNTKMLSTSPTSYQHSTTSPTLSDKHRHHEGDNAMSNNSSSTSPVKQFSHAPGDEPNRDQQGIPTHSNPTTGPRRRPPAVSDVFERLAKTFTVAAQAKVRDPLTNSATDSSLPRRDSHERLQPFNTTMSNNALHMSHIEEGSPTTDQNFTST